MQTSVSLCEEDTTIFGVEWSALFRLRDRLACSYHARCGQRIPIQEFYSAGNQAMTEAIRDFPAIAGHPFMAVVATRIVQAMRTTVRSNRQGWSPSVEVQPWHATVVMPYERTHDLAQLFRCIQTHLGPPDSAMLFALFHGTPRATIAQISGVSERTVFRALARSVDTLKAVLLREGTGTGARGAQEGERAGRGGKRTVVRSC